MTTDLIFHATYIASKIGVTGLTVTIDIDKVERSTGTRTAVITAGSATEGRNGHYYYRLSNVVDLVTCDYIACFKTSGAADQQYIHSGWFPFPLAYEPQLSNLDAVISSRLDAADYTAPPTAAAITDAVWDEALVGHTSAGSTGEALSEAGSAADPLLNQVPGTYPSGSAGHALGRIGSGAITAISPVAADGSVTTYQGDDYKAEDGRAISWCDIDGVWPVLASAKVIINKVMEFPATIVPGANQVVQVELAAAQSAMIALGLHPFQVIGVQDDGNVATLVDAQGSVNKGWLSKRRMSA